MEANSPTGSISTLPVKAKSTSVSKFSERTNSGKLMPDWETTSELFSVTEYVSSTTSGGSLIGIIITSKEILTVARLILSLAITSTIPDPYILSWNERINAEPLSDVFKPLIFSFTENAKSLPFSTS